MREFIDLGELKNYIHILYQMFLGKHLIYYIIYIPYIIYLHNLNILTKPWNSAHSSII